MKIGQMWNGLAAWCIPCVSLAGPLTPPAGPVAPTPGPEPRVAISAVNTPGDADSLFRITQPGSYYLTGNISGEAAKHGIEIAASDVTLDLNGFALLSSGVGLDGVSTAGASRARITVRDGACSGWGDWGIDLVGSGHRIENVQSAANADGGIRVGGAAVLTGCTASGNQTDGFSVTGNGGVVSGCTANGNGGEGFSIGGESSLSSCSAAANGQEGFEISATSSLTACISTGNLLWGFDANANGVTFTGCAAASNLSGGFDSNNGAVFEGCAATSNAGPGFNAVRGAVIRGCTADSNTGVGISGSFGVSVIESTARNNGEHGISAGSVCRIIGNLSYLNARTFTSAAGILVSGAQTLVDGNQCASNGRGVWIVGTATPENIVVRNTCTNNSVANWEISAGNAVAPIVTATTNAAAIVGDTYTGSIGTTNPWANFTR